MECAGKGRGSRCVGPPTRRCSRCTAVSYCSASHQALHWSAHKGECERLKHEMKLVDALNDFPFTFSEDATVKLCEKHETRCSFLRKRGLHGVGMWAYECRCGESLSSSIDVRLEHSGWLLPSVPCSGKRQDRKSQQLQSWKDYYDWRCIPLHSPLALLLHWPLTVFHATEVAFSKNLIGESCKELRIHYLGPEKELLQVSAFAELCSLFTVTRVHIRLIGPAIPHGRDGQAIKLSNSPHFLKTNCTCGPPLEHDESSTVTLQFHRGFYHDWYRDFEEEKIPDLIIALNAGVAAYPSWLPTIELVKDIGVPALFTDYCEEACHLAAACIEGVTGHPLTIPIQLNPFRQPIVVEDTSLHLPCYSNCFLFGM